MGDDIIDGGQGRNTLRGRGGSDTFVLGEKRGVQLIEDFQVGRDRLGYVGDVTQANIHFVKHGSRTIVRSTGDEDIAILRNIQPDQLSLTDVVQVKAWNRHGMSLPTILG